MKFTEEFLTRVQKLSNAFQQADYVLIGAGAGLSTAAGMSYTGERFEKYFSDFARKYGFSDMYSGGFAPFESDEEFWAYWSRYILVNRFECPVGQLYCDLLKLVENKNYFVLTTNVDHQFQRAGFDKKRMFYTQGDYGLWQCSLPCHKQTYDNEQTVRQMFERQQDMRVPSELLPKCPKCGRPMHMNLRSDNTFVEDKGWHVAARRYQDFVEKAIKGKTLYLELGVGGNTPGIIKYPFWRMTNHNQQATYVCVNKGEAYLPEQIASRSIAFDEGIEEVVNAWNKIQSEK
jgi:NAD-dependent SIR2 family protein deacetylase